MKPGDAAPRAGAGHVEVDLRDGRAVQGALAEIAPDAVIHLAALAVPREAQAAPLDALRVNYTAVAHLLERLRRGVPRARLLFVSTGEVYARRALGAPPACEDEPLAPPNVYAATKASAEQLVVLAAERDGLDVVRVRPFNHSGPGRPPLYAESAFAQQVAQLEKRGGEPVVRVGNLEAVRDFSDVRDVAAAYLLLLERGARGEVYNVCSGAGRSIGSVLEYLMGRSSIPLRSERDPARFEPTVPEQVALIGDPARVHRLGWQPQYPFERTLDDVLDYWRARA